MKPHHEQYLIIGGVPKAGTTSLYKYLSDHPDVSSSSLKETRFFLDDDYPIPSAMRFDGRNLDDYQKFFLPSKSGKNVLRVEATPDYLYSKTALQIASLLPNAKIVFLLRDPVERMVSWYKYARQRNMIDDGCDFEGYIYRQLEQEITSKTPVYLQALNQGRYTLYLKPFQKAFQDRCLILDFEDLKRDPLKVMNHICEFSSLSPDFFKKYKFEVENASHAKQGRLYRTYAYFRRKAAHSLYKSPKIMACLQKPNNVIKKILSVNTKKADKVEVSEELRRIIIEYSQRG